MITTTELWLLYVFIALDILAFLGSIFSWYALEDNKLSIFGMLSSMILSFKISNLFIDGTLSKTTSFLSSTNEIISTTDIIRNTAASSIFEFFGMCAGLILVLQIITILKEKRDEEDEEE